MAKDDLTPEEMEALAGINRQIWKAVEPRSIGKHNPNWVRAAKGTPLGNMSYPEIVSYMDNFKHLYLKTWKDFSNGWIDAFGGRDVRPLRKDTTEYLTEFVSHITKNPSVSKKNRKGASEWLLKKLDEESVG
tara:strand:+ start:1184 stop:1579 length:396 start_codon:yes stop_codon:yes gene_type:complete